MLKKYKFILILLWGSIGLVQAQAHRTATPNTDNTPANSPANSPTTSVQLAQVAQVEYRKVPELTGDAEKDKEIAVVRALDAQRFEMHTARMYQDLGVTSDAAKKYLTTTSIPKLTYTGMADGDFKAFKRLFKVWQADHQAEIPAIQQQIAELNKR